MSSESEAGERLGAAAPDRSGKIPLFVKLAFALPAFSTAALAVPITILMPAFYSDVVLAPLGAIAVAIALARALDAITDPVMGWLSDHTTGRWGRRKPWIIFGLLPAALAFYALFAPPESLAPSEAALWFGVSFSLFFLFNTIVAVPHGAFGAELSLDYNDRSSLFGMQSLFVLAGILAAVALPGILEQASALSPRSVYATMALVYAALMLVLYVPLLWRVPERPEFRSRESNPLIAGVRRSFRNRPFAILFSAALVISIPGSLPSIMMPYYVRYVLEIEEPLGAVGVFIGASLIAGLVCLPAWIWISHRLGKLKTLVLSACVGTLAGLLMFFPGPGDETWVALIQALGGSAFGAVVFLLPAMGADVIDYDELRTGKRREAQFGAFWGSLPKLVQIPAASLPLAALGLMGFVPNVAQTPEVTLTIRVLMALVPVAFQLVTLAILLRYPISEAVHGEIRNAITLHANGQQATDPLTGERLAPPGHEPEWEAIGWRLDTFSRGELERIVHFGPRRCLIDVGLWLGASSAVFATASLGALSTLDRVESESAVLPVFLIATAGLAFTGCGYHLARLTGALRMQREPVAPNAIRRHLETLTARR